MDFITDLPPSLFRRHAYDSIFVVTDRYSKMAVFIPCTKDINAVELAEALESNVIKHSGMFESCVSDRGSLFASGWWATFCYRALVGLLCPRYATRGRSTREAFEDLSRNVDKGPIGLEKVL